MSGRIDARFVKPLDAPLIADVAARVRDELVPVRARDPHGGKASVPRHASDPHQARRRRRCRGACTRDRRLLLGRNALAARERQRGGLGRWIGGTGIGRQLAQALGELGADLVLCARKPERCEQAAAELREELGVRALGLRCNVADPAEVATVVARARDELGRVDVDVVRPHPLRFRAEVGEQVDHGLDVADARDVVQRHRLAGE